MKKFKFRLEGLLKIRRFNEERCRTELGHLQVMLENKQNEITNEDQYLDDSFVSQQEMLKGGIQGKQIHFFPMYIEGKREKIEQLKEELKDIETAVSEKREELSKFRAELKVIENLKDKEKLAYKKAYNKKMNQTIEENVRIWSQYK